MMHRGVVWCDGVWWAVKGCDRVWCDATVCGIMRYYCIYVMGFDEMRCDATHRNAIRDATRDSMRDAMRGARCGTVRLRDNRWDEMRRSAACKGSRARACGCGMIINMGDVITSSPTICSETHTCQSNILPEGWMSRVFVVSRCLFELIAGELT